MTSRRTYLTVVAVLAAIIAILTHGGQLMARAHGVSRPAASEFGTGPRLSARGLYTATLKPSETLRPRKMYTVQVSIADAGGKAIDNGVITIDGGMPEHRHGLPTRPRVTRNLGDGSYEISGLRFNMGGWWELKLSVETPAGIDVVTFNLSL